MDRFGTDNQREYALTLATELGMPDLRAAYAEVMGKPLDEAEPLNLSTQEASTVITGLVARYDTRFPGRRKMRSKKRDDPGSEVASNRVAPQSGSDGLALASHQLRRWAQGLDTYVESTLDPDTHWILTRLVQFECVLAATHATQVLKTKAGELRAVNGNEPIKVSHLLDYFNGSEEEAAKAMDVSVTTLRGWGTYVPPLRSWQAEVVTNGRVRAPRRAAALEASGS